MDRDILAFINEVIEEELAEANSMASGNVVGYTLPLGMDPEPGKKTLWSNPKEKGVKPQKRQMPELRESIWSSSPPTSDPGFFYHATTQDNIYDILDAGEMETHSPDYGTDQDVWPDGSTEDRSYFGTSVQHVEPFYPEGKPAILRVPVSAAKFKKEKSTGDIYTTQNIPVSMIQVWSENQSSWVPLASNRVQENVLDQMGQKHVGGAKRKEPYGDTYVGFSSGREEDTSGRERQAGIVKQVNKNMEKKPYSLSDPPSMGISIKRNSLKGR